MIGISKKRLGEIVEIYCDPRVKAEINYLIEYECKELNPWLPIDENTPKDRAILAYNKLTGWYKTKYINGQWPCFGWNQLCGFKIDKADPVASVHYPQPTHYQELPEDPE